MFNIMQTDYNVFFLYSDQPKADPTFVEKLSAQIIRNVQIKIKNIHIRYEDKVTTPNNPFCLGITLKNLEMLTTDDTWNPNIVQEAVTNIFKVSNIKYVAKIL